MNNKAQTILSYTRILLVLILSLCVYAQESQDLTKREIQEYISSLPDKEAQWKANRRRDKEERPNEIIQLLDVLPGMRIGEVGSGFGYFNFFLSEKVGENGIVYANDIDRKALVALEFYAKEFGAIENIVPVLALYDDPCFPSDNLDMVVAYGCFHDIENREIWLKNTVKYLKPKGTLAIIDGYWSEHGNLTLEKIQNYGNQAGLHFLLHKDLSFGERSHHVHLLQKRR